MKFKVSKQLAWQKLGRSTNKKIFKFMIRPIRIVFLFIVVLFPVFAEDAIDNRIITFRNEIIEEINKQRLSYSEDMRFLQEQRTALAEEVSSYSEIVNELTNTINGLNQEIELLKQKINSNKEDGDSRLNGLLDAIKQDRDKNQLAHETILQEILNQLEGVNRPEKVIVTDDSESHKLYKIVKGDTLGSIAKAFNVPLGILKKFNNLESDLIRIDQVLKIPVND